MKINEIFYSVQGEGFHTGRPAVFVRFSGCNLKCDFCDTLHQQGKEMTEEDIIAEIDKYKTAFVVLTGGEPSLQLSQSFIDKLLRNGNYIAVETNGTHELPIGIDWITLSPKYKKPILKKCNELKVVYEEQDMAQYDKIKADNYFVQPCDRKDNTKNEENIQKCINFVKENPKWRISLQTQKILNLQ